jgi:hypothetical protein
MRGKNSVTAVVEKKHWTSPSPMRRAMIRVRFLPWRQEQDSAARIVTQPLLYYHSLSKDPLPFYYLRRKDRRESSLTV